MVLEILGAVIGLGFFFFLPIIIVLILLSVRIIFEYERGIRFTLGKYSGLMEPGINFLIPLIQSYRKVDVRIKTIDIPKQEVMTADNVPVSVNAVVYFKVANPKKAVLDIQDYAYAVSQYAQTALRDIIGGSTLDQVLTNREKLADEIESLVDKETDAWGIDVTAIKIQDVELPQDLKRTMAKQAEAEREKRATIIKAEGEVIASKNLRIAADTLALAPGALHLRTLNTLNDLSSDQSNTVVFAIPLEILRAFESMGKNFKKK
ncbi:MAG: slipin family protein [Candidatus Diapherotrites archaeon]|nr:slipin family protein [Candidatus Diapherotrites archaeon]